MPNDEPTQRTPKGLEIPVPARGQVDDALAKVAEPQVPARRRRRGKPRR